MRFQSLPSGLALILLASGCDPAPQQAKSGLKLPLSPIAEKLSGAWQDLAQTKAADEALVLLDLALAADPTSKSALATAEKILRETTWNFPLASLPHTLPIAQVAFAPPSSLWVTTASETYTTTLRWDLQKMEIGALLFPVFNSKPRSLVFDPSHRFMVIERGATLLLCDAQTLKPISELGPLDPSFTPSAVICFAASGPLLAHPTLTGVWLLRDATTGEIIRSFERIPANAPPTLAAHLGRDELKILREDGSLLILPLSPTGEIRTIAADAPVKILQAEFSKNGHQALARVDPGSHLPLTTRTLTFEAGADASLTAAVLLNRFPFHSGPTAWRGLLADAPATISKNFVQIHSRTAAPLHTESPLSAAAFSPDTAVLGEENGNVTLHRLLPLPSTSGLVAAGKADAVSLAQFSLLVRALTGLRYAETAREFTPLAKKDRLAALAACDFRALRRCFPSLDFSQVFTTIELGPLAPESLLPMWQRLAEADTTRQSWFSILAFSKSLAKTPWHRELTAILEGKSDLGVPTLALESSDPAKIRACLAEARDLPPLLKKLGQSRIAQLQGRPAEALAGWAEPFPTIADARTREDWQGWEQADFAPELAEIESAWQSEMKSIRVTPDSTLADRRAIATKLKDPATKIFAGRQRYAESCLALALASAPHKGEAKVTFIFARLARDAGAPTSACLRVEAMALTALADYKKAHRCWIELITEHPVSEHLPEDYTEAAYTAFENTYSGQAAEILKTGHHRFPNDATYALRAGWISLLTGSPQQACDFLKSGQALGYPPEKSEHALALLATAAAQIGEADDARGALHELLEIAPQWSNPATLAAMPWPREMKTAFSRLLNTDTPSTLDPQLMQDPVLEPMPSAP